MTGTAGHDSRTRSERFTALYREQFADLSAYCGRRLGPETAVDATAEVFLVAWRRFDDLPTGGDARLWLFGVARHVVANQQRGRARRSRLHLRLVDDQQSGTAEPPANDLMLDALHRLDDDDAEVLRLLNWERLSHAEAGVVLGCSTNAVGIRAHRARDRLATIFHDLRGADLAPNPNPASEERP